MTTDASPVFSFLRRPSLVDYPGHLAAVFFVSGCNFRCRFCHNAALMGRRQDGIPWDQLDAACRAFADQWVDAAVISGGEPTLDPDLGRLIRLLRGFGWPVKLDTNGSRPEVLRAHLRDLGYVAMDIKAAIAEYPTLTGYPDTPSIGESVSLIMSEASDYEFRTTVIEAFHTDDQMRQIAELVRGARRLVLQPFVPREGLPDVALRTSPRTSPARLRHLAGLLQGAAAEVSVRGA